MTQSPPPPASSSDSSAWQVLRDRRKVAGLIVIFLSLGSIFAWGISRDNKIGQLSLFQDSAESDTSSKSDSSEQETASILGVPLTEVIEDNNQPAATTGQRSPARTAPPVPPQVAPVPSATVEDEADVVVEEPQPSTLDISDVPETHWAYPYITALHAAGIVPDFPDGKFQPDKPVTRAELAAQIKRAFPATQTQAPLDFPDVSDDYWAKTDIDQAIQMGFMSGYKEGVFRPDQDVPRYQVLISLVSGLQLAPQDADSALNSYTDREQLPDWAVPQVAAAEQAELIVLPNQPNQLQPNQSATRAEVAASIYQALVLQKRIDPISSSN